MITSIYSIVVSVVLLFFFIKIVLVKLLSECKKTYTLRKRGIKIVGKIIEIEKEKDSDGLAMYKPIIEYKTLSGQTFTFLPLDASISKPVLNDSIPVFYDKDNPEIAIIGNGSANRFLVLKTIISFLVLSLLLFFFARSIIFFKE